MSVPSRWLGQRSVEGDGVGLNSRGLPRVPGQYIRSHQGRSVDVGLIDQKGSSYWRLHNVPLDVTGNKTFYDISAYF